MTVPQSVGVVGASTAGAAVAHSLRSLGYEGRIALVGEEPLAPYERPPLSKSTLTSESAPDPLWLVPPAFYDDQSVDLHLDCRVSGIEEAGAGFRLTGPGALADGLAVDAVVLATGGRARPLPGCPDDPRVHTVRTWADSLRLRAALSAGQRVVVVGSGFIGAECAAAASSLGCAVTVLEALPRLFPALGSEAIRGRIEGAYAEHGVAVRTGARVVAVAARADALVVETAEGDPVEADVLVIGIGMVANTDLAAGLGLALADGFAVDEQFRTNRAGVYAIGDAAARELAGGRRRHEHFASAQAHGAAVAHVLMGRGLPPEAAPWAWSDQLGHRIEILGELAGATERHVRDEPAGGMTEFGVRDGILVGAAAIDAPRTVHAARRLVGGRLQGGPAALADPTARLRDLVKT